MSVRGSLLKSVSGISGLSLISRVLGFARERRQLNITGVGSDSDVLGASLTIPSALRKLSSEGSLNPAFIPIYRQLVDKYGQEEADVWASNVLLLFGISAIVLTVLLEVFTSLSVRAIAPGFVVKPSWNQLIFISRLMFLSIVGSTLSSFVNSIWLANKKYLMGSIGSSICNSFIICASFLCNTIEQLAIVIVLGTYIQLIATIVPLRKRIYFRKTTHSMTGFYKLLLPLFASGFLLQAVGFACSQIGSRLVTGHYTYFLKAEKVLFVPVSLLYLGVTTVLIPKLSTRLHYSYVVFGLKYGLFLACMSSAFIYCWASDIAYWSFSSKQVTRYDTEQIAVVLRLLCIGVPGWVMMKISQSTIACARRTYMNIAGNCIQIVIYLTCGLTNPKIASGLAYCSLIALHANVSWCLYQLKRYQLVRDFWKYALFTMTVFTGLVYIHEYYQLHILASCVYWLITAYISLYTVRRWF